MYAVPDDRDAGRVEIGAEVVLEGHKPTIVPIHELGGRSA